jgi:hypothetical protein
MLGLILLVFAATIAVQRSTRSRSASRRQGSWADGGCDGVVFAADAGSMDCSGGDGGGCDGGGGGD